MKKPRLKKSEVVFNADAHTYRIGDTYLSGVTSLLHRVIFTSMYEGVPESTLRAAAQRGTTIHKMIEEYHVNGINLEDSELMDYIEVVGDLTKDWVASEYLVSDNKRYASMIDLVYYYNGTFILSDIKTVSKMDRQYIDYCSWQLSVYAYLFELQNPGKKVGGLSVIWIPQSKNGKPRIIEIDRKPDYMVEHLFEADEANVQLLPKVPVLSVSEELEKDAVTAFYQLSVLKKKYDDIKFRLFQIMKENNIEEATLGNMRLTIVKGYTKEQLDAKKFRELEPALSQKYLKKVYVAESLKVTLKENN